MSQFKPTTVKLMFAMLALVFALGLQAFGTKTSSAHIEWIATGWCRPMDVTSANLAQIFSPAGQIGQTPDPTTLIFDSFTINLYPSSQTIGIVGTPPEGYEAQVMTCIYGPKPTPPPILEFKDQQPPPNPRAIKRDRYKENRAF